jgi:hypothetical protein
VEKFAMSDDIEVVVVWDICELEFSFCVFVVDCVVESEFWFPLREANDIVFEMPVTDDSDNKFAFSDSDCFNEESSVAPVTRKTLCYLKTLSSLAHVEGW